MKMRIMQTKGLRGLLYEFGIVPPEGQRMLLQCIQAELAKAQAQGALPAVVGMSVQEPLRRIDPLQQDIGPLDRRWAAMVQHKLQALPGIGPLTATALVATAIDPSRFASGRQFAAWLGLTPPDESWWKAPPVGHLQARRPVREDFAHPWRQSRYRPSSSQRLDRATAATSTLQRGGGGTGQQARAHRLGRPGQRQGL